MYARTARRWGVLGRSHLGIAYASSHPTRQLLDIWLPTARGAADRYGFPICLWIHGGGWQAGSRALSPGDYPLDVLPYGVAVVSIDYRLSGDNGSTPYPAHQHDCKAALRWIKANARRYHLNPGRVIAFGASAGGHLALHLGLTQGVAAMTDLTLGNTTMDESVMAVCALFAPSVFNQHDADFTSQVSEFGGPASGRGTICSTSTQESWLLGGTGTPINPCSATAEVHNRSDTAYWVANGPACIPGKRLLQGVKLMHGVRSGGIGGDASVAVGQSRRVRDALIARGIAFANGTAFEYHEVPQAQHGVEGDAAWQAERAGIRDWLVARAFA